MAEFAHIVTPRSTDRVLAKLPLLAVLPPAWIEVIMGFLPPSRGARVLAGDIAGWVIECPLAPGRLASLSQQSVASRLERAARLAERLGAGVVAMSPDLVRAAGSEDDLEGRFGLTVTTGALLGLVMALEASGSAVRARGQSMDAARVVVLGAGDAAGAACARILARQARLITLVSADRARAEALAGRILRTQGVPVRWTTGHARPLSTADLLVVPTREAAGAIGPGDIRPGSVVCLAAGLSGHLRPLLSRRDVTVVADVPVLVPGRPDLGPGSRLRPGFAGVAVAEAMLLALEGGIRRPAPGRPLAVEDVDHMIGLAEKHGFRPAV